MSRPASSRRLATVLFLDIVDSTRIAAELGDRRWRELLGTFRQIVRKELKRHRGHEEDTAGDGFFATFAQPADGVRAAVTVARAVQEIGLEVRCGLHFGECETIEGQLGGIAVHIGSRIMSLGGAAQVLITGTVRDLATGAEVEVEDAGTHELKGVPGSWQVWRVTKLEGSPLPAPLDADQAREIRAGHQGSARRSRRRRLVTLGAAVLGLAALLAIAGVLTGNLLAPPPVNLVKIDADTNLVTSRLSDGYGDEHLPNALWLVNGALWQGINKAPNGFEGFVRRDVRTGEV